MKRLFNILILLAIPILHAYSQTQTRADSTDCAGSLSVVWAKTAGFIENDGVNSIATDNDGNIIIAGYFNGSVDFLGETVVSNGGSDFFVAKLYANGTLDWIRTGGGIEDDQASSVAVDNDGRINIIGNFRGQINIDGVVQNSNGDRDIFLIQYMPDGDIVLPPRFALGLNDDIAGDITTDSENNIIITGSFYQYLGIGGSTIIGKGANDFFIAKYSQNLAFQWRTNHGSTQNDYGIAVACDPEGNIFVSGNFSGTIDFGSDDLTALGINDIFLAKYHNDGEFIWAKRNGTTADNDKAADVNSDIFGNAYLLSKFGQTTNMAVVNKYDEDGNLLLTKDFGGAGTIEPKSIIADNAQNFYISGKFLTSADFGDGIIAAVGQSDYFVVKYNYDGAFKFKDVAGSLFNDCANSICLDDQNSLIAGGFCTTGITIGTEYYEFGDNKEDILVVKYDDHFGFGELVISSIECRSDQMCVEIDVIGGEEPYTFYCNGIAGSNLFCDLSTGSYQIVVVDNNNCFIETEILIKEPTRPEVVFEDMVICPFETVPLDAGAGTFEYSWSTGEDSQIIEISDPDIYSVVVTDTINGCSSLPASIEITELENKDLLPDTDSLCRGEELTISTYNTYAYYLWSNGTNYPTFTSGAEGEHSVRVLEYSTQCYYYDTIRFGYYFKPSVEIGDDATICDGDSIQITAPAGFESYEWNNGSTELSVWATIAGAVSITVIDNNGCHAYDTVDIGYATSPVFDLGEDFTICTDNSVILDPHALGEDLSYIWMGNDLFGSPTFLANNTGFYWVEVFSASGCSSTDSIYLTIFEAAHLNLGSDIEFCFGGSDTVKIIGDFVSYEWSNGAEGTSLEVTQTEEISVTVTDNNGCSASDIIRITEYDLVNPFIGYDTVLCTGDNYVLRTSEDYSRYHWHNNSTAPTFTVTQPGTYAVTVYDDIDCSASTSINIEYQEGPQLISASAGGGIIEVNATGGTPPLIYSYDGDTWQTSNIFTGLESDTYTISIMDKNYCMVTTVIFLDQSLQIPEFFTPNSDGYNDWWVITGLYHFPEAEVQIFDRYGKKLYQFAGSDFGWDGVYAGYPLPSDTYWYTITLGEALSPLTGSVTIKR